jgi:Tol biopolymer transport system component/DNA-binding winged helix-turn-helix (wHTH) protein
MTMASQSPFKLGDWLVEPDFNQLSRGRTKHRVEPKVMSVLVHLAEQAGHVVSKDEILRVVWPDTFVGEDALTRCISVLRHIFEDDPRNPRFIKTVSKVGYCLLVAALPESDIGTDTPDPQAGELPNGEAHNHSAAVPESERETAGGSRTGMRALAAALVLVLAGGLAIGAIHVFRADSTPPSYRTFQLTTNAGEQSRPALSPDGKRLAFVWTKEDGSHQHIYIKELGREPLLRLTDLPDDEYSPVWSPDGKQIAFLSSSATGLGLYVTSFPSSGPARKVYIPGETTHWEQGALSWSPDGKSFILVDHIGSQPSSSVYLIDVETLHARPLTTPPAGWEGDLCPLFSPDGSKIAFVRASESEITDLYWIPASGGEPHQVTQDRKVINGIAWSSDGKSIVFSSNRAGQEALWKVTLEGGTPKRLPVGTEDATEPSIPPKGNHLAFVEGGAIFGILRIGAAKENAREEDRQTVVSSTVQDSAPSVSPDGTQFAFQSARSGYQQIWLSSIDGQSLRQLTPDGGPISGAGSPSWSLLGDQIAFDSRRDGHSHIFVIPVSGGTPKQLTFGDVNDIVPRWSVAGHSIYFRSNRGGRWQLWKLPAAGGTPQPVTSDDGIAGQESTDGKWLYFARGGENGIWRMPLAGGEAVRILDQPATRYWAYWQVTKNGIYFLDQRQSTPSISIFDPASGKTTSFAKLNRLPPYYSGIGVVPGKRELLISDMHEVGSHISMAEGAF